MPVGTIRSLVQWESCPVPCMGVLSSAMYEEHVGCDLCLLASLCLAVVSAIPAPQAVSTWLRGMMLSTGAQKAALSLQLASKQQVRVKARIRVGFVSTMTAALMVSCPP